MICCIIINLQLPRIETYGSKCSSRQPVIMIYYPKVTLPWNSVPLWNVALVLYGYWHMLCLWHMSYAKEIKITNMGGQRRQIPYSTRKHVQARRRSNRFEVGEGRGGHINAWKSPSWRKYLSLRNFRFSQWASMPNDAIFPLHLYFILRFVYNVPHLCFSFTTNPVAAYLNIWIH